MPATHDLARLRRAGRSPSNVTSPSVGMYSPVRQLKNVVLPAPFGPIRPTISPLVDVHAHVVDGGEAAEPHGHAARPRGSAVADGAGAAGRPSVTVTARPPWRCSVLADFSSTARPAPRRPRGTPAGAAGSAMRPSGPEAHHHDEQQAEDQQPVLGDEAELLGQQLEDRRTDEDAEHGAHAAEHDGREQEGRLEEDVLVGRDRHVVVRLDRAGQTGQEGTAGEGEQLQRRRR